jgi:hypothetical protein
MTAATTAALHATSRTVHVEAMPDHLQSLARGKPVNALAELIWNALDADATEVQITVNDNDLGSPVEIRVSDNGDGIRSADAARAFGNLGGSWKKERARSARSDKRLHGRDGKGRFKAFAIGERAVWNTTFKEKGDFLQYQISGQVQDLSNFAIGTPVPAEHLLTGTRVTIDKITESLGAFSSDGSALQQLNEQFAIYLRDYPNTMISFRGDVVDPKAVQRASTTVTLVPFTTDTGVLVEGMLEVIEWKFAKKERKVCLCDANGYMLHEIEAGVRPGPEYNFTAYVRSAYIARLHDENVLDLEELNHDLARLVDDARQKLRAYFRQRKAETASELVDEWKKEGIYPYSGDAADALEQARREVFDICAISVNDYLDSFKAGTTKDRKFTLRMIRTAVDENPEALKKILGEILDLPKDKQNDLAELLDQTSLSSIIEASKTVSDRLKFVAGFKELIFQPESKGALKERKELHRMLEGETWLFGEEYLLTSSDENLTTVLRKHLDKLRPPEKKRRKRKDDPVIRDDGSQAVIDLMLARELPQYGRTRKEYLVVELKRPSQKIDLAVKGQIESYALAVMKDERFDTKNTHWTFIAVSNDMTEEAAETVRQTDKPVGYFLNGPNYRVGLVTWAELLQASLTRLEMFREKLDYVATKDQGVALLHDRYRKFLPSTFVDPRQARG